MHDLLTCSRYRHGVNNSEYKAEQTRFSNPITLWKDYIKISSSLKTTDLVF